jgi:predicted peptidase
MIRRLTTAVAALGLFVIPVALGSATAQPASGRAPSGIQGVTAITNVYTFGQKVAAVAVEYSSDVNARTLDLHTYTVSDSVYNFRFDPIEDLAKRADRTITRVYTNDHVGLRAHGTSTRGRYVIVELSPSDAGGNTVIQAACSTPLCYVKVNPGLPTEVVQNENVYAQPGTGVGHGTLLAAASPAAHGLTGKTVNLYVDDFTLDTYTQAGAVLPYAYYLPRHYNPHRKYPMVVILPGYGMGYNGENAGVQIAADIPATAWVRPEWKGTNEDVIVLAPQNQRVGVPAEASIMVSLVEDFMRTHSVAPDRVYASTVSYGSTTAWQAMATNPGLFSAALITGGFQISADQAAQIATDRTPIWITHGLHDPLLPVAFGRNSTAALRSAYVAAGVDPAKAANLVRYTEFGDDAYSEPDYHAVMGPTYEDTAILRWLLAQRH